MMITVQQQYLTKNDCYRSGSKINITHIQLHSIGTPQPRAEALMSYWNQPGIQQMVHALVQADGKVFEIMESNKRSWADAGFGNNHAFTIEMMEPDTIRYTSGANYDNLNPGKTKAHVLGTYQAAVAYIAKKCKEFGLNPTATKNGVPVVFSHYEGNVLGVSSNHGDPDHLWRAYGLNMYQFRKDVEVAMNEDRCLAENTLIKMYDGSEKQIKDVRIGDSVLGGDGSRWQIHNVWVGKEHQPLIRLCCRTGETVLATQNHVISTDQGLKRAAEVTMGMRLAGQAGWLELEVVYEEMYDGTVYNLDIDGHLMVAGGIVVGDMLLQNTLHTR